MMTKMMMMKEREEEEEERFGKPREYRMQHPR